MSGFNFDVAGWKVPSTGPTSTNNTKKRKRPGSDKPDPALSVNLDKLIGQLDNKLPPSSKPKQGEKPHSSLKQKQKKSQLASGVTEVREPGENVKQVEKRKQEPKRPKPTATTPIAQPDSQPEGLTPLQARMWAKLEGARFRMVNETLYKSASEDSVKLMQDDPKVYEDYHAGFRNQVTSWPSNPVQLYIEQLSGLPSGTIIADLGCGDAALAKALVPQNKSVLSYDLVSDGVYVTSADMCGTLPLPGAEGGTGDGQGGIVNIVVCALSLMATNWPSAIRESWRILRPGGELRIAEVASRFTSIDDFVKVVASYGFKLKSKDTSNTHFTLFEFVKITRTKARSDKEWAQLLNKGDVLKPCEYKRR